MIKVGDDGRLVIRKQVIVALDSLIDQTRIGDLRVRIQVSNRLLLFEHVLARGHLVTLDVLLNARVIQLLVLTNLLGQLNIFFTDNG